MVQTFNSIRSPETLEFHSENITNASLIKLRIKTCGTTTVQLHDVNNKKYILRISRAFLVAYFPSNTRPITQNVTNYHRHFENCTNQIVFYWIRFTADRACASVGPIPDDDCSTASISVNVTDQFNVMQVAGFMQEATIWIGRAK